MAGTPTSVSLGASAPTGAGSITATLHGTTIAGIPTTVRSTTYVDTVDGTPIADVSGQDLKLTKIKIRRQHGDISAATARTQRLAVLGATHSTQQVAPDTTCTDVCVSGLAKWTDHVGGTHVIPEAPVQVYGVGVAGAADTLLATTATGDDGTYSADVSPSTGQSIYVRVLAAGHGFAISSSKTGEQYIQSSTVAAPAAGSSVTVDFTTSNDETMDNNTAFSVQNALEVGNKFVVAMNGKGYPAVKVDFPNLAGGSYYQSDNNTLYIDAGDRWDWDPTLHEFGHSVMRRLDIENNPGGDHGPGENLSDVEHSKSLGTRLAWGEAWPTFFSLSAQKFEDAAALHIPNVGDDLYQDTEDASLVINPEKGEKLGEDDEVDDLAILWDLYDGHSDGLDHVSLGARGVWNTLKGSKVRTLSDVYHVFAPGNTAKSNPVNQIFTQYNVSPLISGGPAKNRAADAGSPTLTWKAGNGGTHKNNSFVVEYRNAANERLLFRSPRQTTRSYTAPSKNWVAAKRASNGTVDITVVGTQTDKPVTGPYRSAIQAWHI